MDSDSHFSGDSSKFSRHEPSDRLKDRCPTRPPQPESIPSSFLPGPCTAGPTGARGGCPEWQKTVMHQHFPRPVCHAAGSHWQLLLTLRILDHVDRTWPITDSPKALCFTVDRGAAPRAVQAEIPRAPGSPASGASPTQRLMPQTPPPAPDRCPQGQEAVALAFRKGKGQRCVTALAFDPLESM